jgi:2-keto-4-pentenoate hydratase
MSANPDLLASRLATAHCSGDPVRADDALLPPDIAAAYAVQARLCDALAARVGGWKVGIRPDGTPMAAPLYLHLIKPSGAAWPLPSAGPLIVEVELALRLARDLPVREHPYARDEIAAAVGEVLVGIELIHTRLAAADPPFLAFLADNLGNAGYVTGGATRDFGALDLARLRCTVTVDGAPAHDKVGGHPQGDPYAPLLACLGQGLVPLRGFRAGHIVTTGSLIVPLRPTRRTSLRAELEGIGTVDATFGG